MITRFDPPSGISSDSPGERRTQLGVTTVIKTTTQESQGAFGLVELTLSPYFGNMAAHWHRETMETIYVLAGTVAFTIDDVTFTGTGGRVVIIPPRTIHQVWNPTVSPAMLLHFYTPGGFESYFAEVVTACNAGQIDANQLNAIAAKYDQFVPPLLA